MKYYVEDSLRNFQFWRGAKDTVEDLTDEDLDVIEGILEGDESVEWSDTMINDLFWHERDLIADWLGYKSYEHMLWERNGGKTDAQELLETTYPDCDTTYIENWVDENWDMNASDAKNMDEFYQEAISDGELPDPNEEDEDDN